MKVFVQPHAELAGHRGTLRIAKALEQYAPPGIAVVTDRDSADLVVLYVIGYPETVKAIEELKAQGKRYAIVQLCLRTTQESSTEKWLPLWADAACVWSYYDLEAACREDVVNGFLLPDVLRTYNNSCEFYHAPLGVDSVFSDRGVPRQYAILTSGYVPDTEGVLEAMEAARRVGLPVFHLGPHDDRYGNHVTCALGITDDRLASIYSRCVYVAGLRRAEGFELPAAEGLLCGARPIMFDAPHYRAWFDGFAEFIPEGDFETVTSHLERLFLQARDSKPQLPHVVSEHARAAARARFDWKLLVEGFWERIEPAATVDGPRPKILWVGDAVVSSGFARCTHKTLSAFLDTWDVVVLGVGHNGDPHPYPYPIYTAFTPGWDQFGLAKLPSLIRAVSPDVVVVQTDPWHVEAYRKAIPATVPMVGAIAVDGKNCRGNEMNGLDLAIFWTQFGLNQARLGGYTKPAAVVPLGVDLDVYHPYPRAQMRAQFLQETGIPLDAFIVGNVNRNYSRKRLDLTVQYFAEWVKTRGVPDAYLFLHIGPTADVGYDIPQLARYYLPESLYGKRVLQHVPPMTFGVEEAVLAAIYSMFDLMLTTTQGEGWGLPTMEGMACGIPQIVPTWAALGEWTEDAAYQIPCPTTITTTGNINSIGGVPDRQATIEALDRLYQDKALRAEYAKRGRALVERPCYRWSNIGASFKAAVEGRLAEMRAAPTKELAIA